ncbi:hypothetical protein E2542_SST11453 [Spatholobus suberectus]|nr:hypothetical protein E2542_SST11453 [Spatholobus suberectus]
MVVHRIASLVADGAYRVVIFYYSSGISFWKPGSMRRIRVTRLSYTDAVMPTDVGSERVTAVHKLRFGFGASQQVMYLPIFI